MIRKHCNRKSLDAQDVAKGIFAWKTQPCCP